MFIWILYQLVQSYLMYNGSVFTDGNYSIPNVFPFIVMSSCSIDKKI